MKTLLSDYKVFHAKLTPAICVDVKASIQDTLKEMRARGLGCVLIKENLTEEAPVSHVFTERDFMNKIVGQDINWADSVAKYGTENPMTIGLQEPLLKAFEIMKKNNFRHLPVVDAEGKTLYVLSIRRIIELVAEHFPAEILNLPPRLSQTADTREGG